MTQDAVEYDLDAEVSALIDFLRQTEARLEHITAGQVDSVVDASGRPYLLRRSQEFLRNLEQTKQTAILDAFPAHIALLDARGIIVAVNQSWHEFAAANALQGPPDAIGSDYIGICDAAKGTDSSSPKRTAEGIRAVLSGKQKSFVAEYPCHSPTEQRWFLMTVSPLVRNGAGGAIVMHINVTAERRSANNLKISESRFQQMAENISDAFFLLRTDGSQIYYVSPAFERIWGRTCESLYQNPASWLEMVHPDDRDDTHRKIESGRGTALDFEYRIVRADGELRWIQVRTFPVWDEHGVPYRTAGVASDITARKQGDARIAYLNRVYAMLGGINKLIVRARERGSLFREACRIAVEEGQFPMSWIGIIDPSLKNIVPVASAGLDEEFLAGLKARLLFSSDDPLGSTLAARTIRTKQPMISNDSENDPKVLFGKIHAKAGIHSIAVFPLIVADVAVGVLALYAREIEFFHEDERKLLTQLADDISFAIDHIDKQEELQYLAYYDRLTGLANERLFLDRVAQHVRGAASGEHRLALCLLDLEHFKNFNDTYGRSAGDALLKQMAQWLSTALGDSSLVARIAADKFAVVMPKVAHEEELAQLLEKMLAAFLEHPFQLNSSTIRIAGKVGVAVFPDDGTSASVLFRNAEVALKKAKIGGDRYLFYAQRMTATVAGRLTLVFRLRHALENQEFALYYQPKVRLATGELIGAEALLRWRDPKTGLVPPGRFISILEETGLILEVGRWALQTAVADYLRWCDAGLRAVRIAVNVSPLQLRHSNFIAEVKHAIGVDARAPAGLELEITESVIMHDVQSTISSLKSFRAMGIKIAIDDFGTGFSSLNYLAKLPVDTLKIDRSFVTEMSAGPEGLALVSTIINLARSLKLNVVAEGVETKEQSRVLQRLGCQEMQGYLICEPLPVELFEARFLNAVTNST